MNELTLDKMQRIEFGILKHFDVFCKEHNIKYYLSNGTLLGAVKYNGFIPWDDDVDVFVPRDDYDRLLKIYEDNEQYKLFSFEKDESFHFPFAKLCDLSTRKIMPEFRNTDAVYGLEMDIFPLDCWSSDCKVAQKEVRNISREIMFLQASQYIKSPTKHWKTIVWKLISIYARIRKGKYFNKKIVKKSKANKQEHPAYVGCKTWCLYGKKEIIPAEVFDDVVYVEFEGQMFPAPIGYDTYLRSLYGDYEKDPPKEKQKSNHRFRAYRR